jgi:hypothetical protein
VRAPTIEEALVSGRIPADTGLAFGQVRVEGWRRPILGEPKTNVEFRNHITGQDFRHTVEKSGDFFLVLPTGHYTVTSVWSGFEQVMPHKGDQTLRFTILPGSIMYLGTLVIRLPSTQTAFAAGIWILNEFDTAVPKLKSRYPFLLSSRLAEEGLMVYR